MQLLLNKKMKNKLFFFIINRIKHFFLGNIVIYEALGQYHLPSGSTNHDIAQKEVLYSVNLISEMTHDIDQVVC